MNKKIIITLTTACLFSLSPAFLNSDYCLEVPQTIYAKVSTTESHQNLVNAINSLANKDDLQARESNIIQAAQTNANDTATARDMDNSKTTQKDLKNYLKQFEQLTKIDEQAEKKVKKLKSSLTPSDYKKLKRYDKSLDKYIETLQDYVSNLESEGAVSSDPNASISDKKDAQNDINKA